MAKKSKKKNTHLKPSKSKKKKTTKKELGAKININGKPKNDIPVVGIGASAGGLEAFSQLISALPLNTGMAFVFIQHLAPRHESMLTDLLAKSTGMKVVEVKDNMEIVANQVFVIPPNKYITIKEKKLLLSEREKSDGHYMPVDHFFRSLANEQGSKSIGVILSGTASDGTLGLRAIKAEGGLTFAQNEASAKFFGMPYNAVASGNVDFVLPPDKIAKELARIGNHPYLLSTSVKEEEALPEPDDHLSQIFKRLRSSTGADFSNYKLNTVKRRITRRMILRRIDNIEDYVKYLKANRNEIQDLYQDLLINVTHFFRDSDVFETLKRNVFPEITKNMNHENPLRIWIPGCSTGEEVYSIAISLFEFLRNKSAEADIQIFATDINESSVERARNGIYQESISIDVPADIIKNYFVKIGSGYQIVKKIRDICIFARQDISKDPPFSRIDFISCRNILIYLSQALQKKIIPVLHYALKPNGYLLLGTSESIGTFADLFSLVENKNKLYKKKFAPQRMDFNFNYPGHEKERASRTVLKEVFSRDIDIQKEADKFILSKYTPPGVLIKSNLEIIQFRGDVGEFIKPMPGEASFNLFRMAREGISLELHNSIRKAKNSEKPVSMNAKIDHNGKKREITIETIPIKIQEDSKESYFLILFNDSSNEAIIREGSKKPALPEKTKPEDIEMDKLRGELTITREHLQSIIEEREATNEELRSALEELQSSNEELQSTNEEMETAKEELQSTNEELITVNEELEKRNTELTDLNSDLVNLFSSINVPVVILDRELKIRRYTPKAEQIWNLIGGDIGRPLSDISPNMQMPGLKEKIAKVTDTLEVQEIEAKDNSGNWYMMKIRPYKTIENKINGVVISLYESNILQGNIDSIFESFSKSIFNTVREPLLVFDKNLKIVEANKSFYERFNTNSKDVIGNNLYNINKEIWDTVPIKKIIEEILEKNSSVRDFKIRLDNNEMVINAGKIHFPDKEEELVLLALN